jgi:hypothetical protein
MIFNAYNATIPTPKQEASCKLQDASASYKPHAQMHLPRSFAVATLPFAFGFI